MLFVHCKDTNLKAIHNEQTAWKYQIALFVHCKDTNLKAIHNAYTLNIYKDLLFVHCKDTNLKAIHNNVSEYILAFVVVRALQRY